MRGEGFAAASSDKSGGLTPSPCYASVRLEVRIRFRLFVLCLALAVGCATGTSIRTYPPRPADCEIEIIEASGVDAPGWTVIASLVRPIASEDTDPLSPEAVDSVRADVCEMGGEAISFVSRHPGRSEASPNITLTIGPGVTYDVWRRQPER